MKDITLGILFVAILLVAVGVGWSARNYMGAKDSYDAFKAGYLCGEAEALTQPDYASLVKYTVEPSEPYYLVLSQKLGVIYVDSEWKYSWATQGLPNDIEHVNYNWYVDESGNIILAVWNFTDKRILFGVTVK